MDIHRICRTCLNEVSTDFVSIHSHFNASRSYSLNNQNLQITNILDILTCDKYNSIQFPYPDKICERCFNELKVAFDFNQRCTDAFEQLIKLSEENDKKAIEFTSVDEIKPIVEVEIDSQIDSQEFDDYDFPECPNLDSETDEYEQEETKIETKIVESKRNQTKVEKSLDTKVRAYQCDICERSFTRHTHLKRHMTIHTDERAFACKLCDKKFRRADHLKNHENYHAQIKPHICKICQKTFSRAEHLRRHMTSRHTDKVVVLQCSECEYKAENTKSLNIHRKIHKTDTATDPSNFPCKFCDQQFTSKTELNEHNKCHNNERPYLCSECGMRFIRNDYLVVHMRRHNGEKPYQCRFCDRAFPRTTDLTVHERYHTNEKKFTCSLCGKGFQRAYNLSVHMRVHTGEKPYQCHHCSKRFSQNNDLKAHIRRHTGERYQCNICSASFIQLYLLSNHKKSVHGIDTKSNISRLTKFESNATTSIQNQEPELKIGCTE